MELELARQSPELRRRSTLRLTMREPQSVHVCVDVFLGHREKLLTFFQRGFHRKHQDQARRAVPDALAITLVARRSLAHRVCCLEELSPATLGRADPCVAVLDERRRARLGKARTTS